MIRPIHGSEHHDDRCPHCRALLLRTGVKHQDLFPNINTEKKMALQAISALSVYIDGDDFRDSWGDLSVSKGTFDKGLVVGQCPWCEGWYYSIWITAISRDVGRNFEDMDDEQSLLEAGGYKVYYIVNMDGFVGVDRPKSWLMERMESVCHPNDAQGESVRIDRHWVGPVGIEPPYITDGFGVCAPKTLDEGDIFWRDSYRTLCTLLPAVIVECQKFNVESGDRIPVNPE